MLRKTIRPLAVAAGVIGAVAARAQPQDGASAETVAWFQATEQALMSSIAPGDRLPWERVADPSFILTTEEGEVLSREQLLRELRPMPPGLAGEIAVRELSVQEFPAFAVVRFLADEWQTVFGQKLTTHYRVTDTFRRDGSHWTLVASHLCVVTRDPPERPFSSAGWSGFVGRYRLLPDGWTFSVEMRDGRLFGGRDKGQLRPLLPLAPNVFVRSGSLGEWIFVVDASGRATAIVNYRKFAPLLWTRVDPE